MIFWIREERVEASNMKLGAKVFPLTEEQINKQTGAAKLVATGSLYINDDFVINGVKVNEWGDELIVNMPSHFNPDAQEYQETVFPVTAEARKQIIDCVIEAYRNPEQEKKEFQPTECKTKIEASLIPVSTTNSNLKATGQVKLDDSIVIQNVKVFEGEKGTYVAMPGRTDKLGEWHDFANPITADAHQKLTETVMETYAKAGHIESNVQSYADLGAKKDIYTAYRLDNDYAKLLCERLNAEGVRYSAKIAGTTSIAINKSDQKKYNEISSKTREDFKQGVRAQDKTQQIDSKLPYIPHESLLEKDENNFFKNLRNNLNNKVSIFAKVRVADIIDVDFLIRMNLKIMEKKHIVMI